jgi:hypothetical protein
MATAILTLCLQLSLPSIFSTRICIIDFVAQLSLHRQYPPHINEATLLQYMTDHTKGTVALDLRSKLISPNEPNLSPN